jgi:hypothetical protein
MFSGPKPESTSLFEKSKSKNQKIRKSENQKIKNRQNQKVETEKSPKLEAPKRSCTKYEPPSVSSARAKIRML